MLRRGPRHASSRRSRRSTRSPGNLPAAARRRSWGARTTSPRIGAALDDARLVTLTGVGGVGKTRLALEVAAGAARASRTARGGASSRRPATTTRCAEVVVGALGIAPQPGLSLEASIVELLAHRDALLVLDNCEHLLDERPVSLADGNPAGVPGRARCSRPAGRRWPSTASASGRCDRSDFPTPTPTSKPSSGRTRCALFVDARAGRAADFVLDAGNGPAVAEICRRLDGIPLALELAAARAESMSPAEIADHLDERFRLLTGGRRQGVERHRTLRGTIDWSFSLLDARRAVDLRSTLGVRGLVRRRDALRRWSTGDGVETWDVSTRSRASSRSR